MGIIIIRKAQAEDMPFIEKGIRDFRLDDEDLLYSQFVVAEEGEEKVGFGRIRPHRDVYELGSVGVIEERRSQGIGKMIIEHLIRIFPVGEVYVTTDLPKYFERLGFHVITPGPQDLVEKLKGVCKTKRREGAVVMVHQK